MAGKTINLNDPNDFTMENVRVLIASGDNEKHNQLRVTTGGLASFVSWSPDDPEPNRDSPTTAFQYETLTSGSGWVGLNAAEDNDWVKELFDWLAEAL